MLISVKLLTKYVIIITFMHKVRYIKSSSESKLFQSRCAESKISGRPRQKERQSRSRLKQALLTDLDAKLFMYSIQSTRLRPNLS